MKILSGVFEGKTTGTPVSLMIENVDQRSKDYSDVAKAYRPGHADYAYDAKYGFRDYRGGGRSSARETAARVAAGAVARLVIPEVSIRTWVAEIGGRCYRYGGIFDADEIGRNPFFCPDAKAAKRWEAMVDGARKDGCSLGAIVACEATGVPAGWGAPGLAKLDSEIDLGDDDDQCHQRPSRLAMALQQPGCAVKKMRGMRCNRAITARALRSNHDAGGTAGGISTGQPVFCRVAFKPTSSILTPVDTITREGEATEIVTKGRHDPCVGIRGTPVVEAMMALVLADQKMMHRAQCG